MKKLFAVVLSMMMLLTSVSALADTLTMATNASFPPYEYWDGDQMVGIDVEIAEAVCAEMGYELDKLDMDFNAIINAVTSGKADFGMAGMTVTEERQQSVAFSISYATGVQSIIVKEGSPIASYDDLAAEGATYKVGVQMATTGHIYAEDEFGVERVVLFDNGNDATMALKNGKVDCVIIDNEPAKAYVAANEGLVILDSAYAVEDYAACFAKDNTELVEKFNAALQKLIDDGTVAGIVAKYIKAE
ncbi:MAG: transporter substrate-binding domain-containing protein [Eubacteriales bacterium]|nr:transporter substrate-binding domain-containing protein [Eubacteriales bacterium]